MPAPEKPSLDGLEEKWSTRWEADGTYRFDRTKSRDRGVLDRHAAADRQRVAAHGLDVRVRADRRHRPVPADAGPRGLLSDGMGRQRPPDRASGAEPLRRALRPVVAVRPRLRRTGGGRRSARKRSRSRVATSSSCASDSPPRTSRCSSRCGAPPGSRSTGASRTRPSATAAQRTSQRAFLRNLARGEAYQAEAPTLWDVDFRTAVAQAELEDREMPGAYHALRFHGVDGASDIVIETTRPELLAVVCRTGRAPRRRAVRRSLRQHRAHARCSTSRFPSSRTAGRSREGIGHRDDLHVRRHHRRGVVARARSRDAPVDRLGRSHRASNRRCSTVSRGPHPHSTRTPSSRARR